MGYIIAGVIFVVIIGVLIKLLEMATIGDSKIAKAVLLLLIVMGMSALFYIFDNTPDPQAAPCVRWETRSMLVGKVMTPYRVCVERGEWITEENSQ